MDFHEYTSLDQFDQEKINRFARLDAIPGFCLLRSEKEYLDCYRRMLEKAISDQIDAEPAVKDTDNEEEPEEKEEKEEKTKKKSKKTVSEE